MQLEWKHLLEVAATNGTFQRFPFAFGSRNWQIGEFRGNTAAFSRTANGSAESLQRKSLRIRSGIFAARDRQQRNAIPSNLGGPNGASSRQVPRLISNTQISSYS